MFESVEQPSPMDTEMVEASCGHLMLRPPGWGEGHGPVVQHPAAVQAAMDRIALQVGTRFFKRQEMPGIGELRAPVIPCPDCRVKWARWKDERDAEATVAALGDRGGLTR